MIDAIQGCNFILIFQWLSDWEHVWLVSRALLVDVFFVFGGLLVSYTFMKERSKGKSFNLAIHFIHRYLRLTPVMAVMLLFNATLFRRIGSGPVWKIDSQEVEEECQTNWWIYMLYINNWFPIQKVCLWDERKVLKS
jgi:peptidoglycan/LPS O-acetylase OafA/YrhL